MPTQPSKDLVLIVGSINTDLVVRSLHLPRPGETIGGREYSECAGGKGANQAIAAARIGAEVAMIGCVGADKNGEEQLFGLKREGIDRNAIEIHPSMQTGVAIVTVADDGENSIVVIPGSNGQVTPEMVARHEAIFKNAAVVVCQLEIPRNSVYTALQLAKRLDRITVLNPAPAASPLPANWFHLIDFLILNEVEAAILTGRSTETKVGIEKAANELRDAGVKNVVITLGSQGVYMLPELEKGTYFAARRAKAIDTTAAGDTFIGVFAAQLAARQRLEDAIDLAQRAAAISVTRTGAQSSIPSRDEVDCAR